MTYVSPASFTAYLFRRAARAVPPAAVRAPGPVARMLIKVAVFAPLLVGAFALRYAAMVFQP
ncbi:hypothetical protein [Azorhizobium sp. AG788]|uniref:hypothetical protein n=1 Tax=Azorhizobium sp. AG788 TaxID=2183897 RepID=UPI00313943B2